ncbi:hypothetical protein HGRIS_000859 [Hohenbuehelia grisea]|uniref:Uncharacterized protein n=1 Tax=Hohenbuehelia grisea TaxID=104357 RepID=A0ABR3IPY5_9AGAR
MITRLRDNTPMSQSTLPPIIFSTSRVDLAVDLCQVMSTFRVGGQPVPGKAMICEVSPAKYLLMVGFRGEDVPFIKIDLSEDQPRPSVINFDRREYTLCGEAVLTAGSTSFYGLELRLKFAANPQFWAFLYFVRARHLVSNMSTVDYTSEEVIRAFGVIDGVESITDDTPLAQTNENGATTAMLIRRSFIRLLITLIHRFLIHFFGSLFWRVIYILIISSRKA